MQGHHITKVTLQFKVALQSEVTLQSKVNLLRPGQPVIQGHPTIQGHPACSHEVHVAKQGTLDKLCASAFTIACQLSFMIKCG